MTIALLLQDDPLPLRNGACRVCSRVPVDDAVAKTSSVNQLQSQTKTRARPNVVATHKPAVDPRSSTLQSSLARTVGRPLNVERGAPADRSRSVAARVNSDKGEAAVDCQDLPGDVTGPIRQQEYDGIGDFGCRALSPEWHRRAIV